MQPGTAYALTVPGFGAPADELLADGLTRLRPTSTRASWSSCPTACAADLGRFFVRNLCMELDAYLDRTSGKPLFSKTI
ncbi:MAG: hypothetical protein IPM94_14010 [bacterium]|nr:hypothetical protein [bacterium]